MHPFPVQSVKEYDPKLPDFHSQFVGSAVIEMVFVAFNPEIDTPLKLLVSLQSVQSEHSLIPDIAADHRLGVQHPVASGHPGQCEEQSGGVPSPQNSHSRHSWHFPNPRFPAFLTRFPAVFFLRFTTNNHPVH